MKIIGGIWKGTLLKHPPSRLSRPTQERVKKSIFDILAPFIRQSHVLDLFAGSGSLGLEALSRGAGEVIFVEWNPLCVKCFKENLAKLRGPKGAFWLEEDVFQAIRKLFSQKKSFDVIFMDPPYTQRVTTKCLRTIGRYDILTRSAILVIRHSRKEDLPPQEGELFLWRKEPYGETDVSFYRKGGE